MDRSLYPDGVEVRQSNLAYTEESRAFHILQRNIDTASTGVVLGLISTPNGATINITAGYGYCPNGEYVELPSGVSSFPLADYAVGVKNYIILSYTETYEDPKPHKESGESLPTKAVRSYRLEAITEAEYNSLPTSDDDLDNNAFDRALVIAVVTAQGSGTNLISSNIEISTAFGGGTTALIVGTLTGVTILRISDDTPSGDGTLTFVLSGTTLTWIAPGDSSGVSVDVGSGGVYVLTSQPSGYTIAVLISEPLLPTSNTSVSVSVTNIYKQNILRHSALDIQHRSFIGSGIPTPNNPHGLTPGDLGLGETQTEFHQQVFHSNAITSDSTPSFMTPSINTGIVPHRINIVAPVPGDSVYIGGFPHNQINGTSILFTDVVDDAHALYDVFADFGGGNGVANFSKYERIRFDVTPPPPITGVFQLRDISDGMPAGPAELEYLTGPSSLRFKAPGDATFGTQITIHSSGPAARTYRLYSETGEHWIDAYVRASVYWGSISTGVKNMTVAAPQSQDTLNDKFLICTLPFSGAGTGFLGNGFGSANSPNDPNDKRLIGLTGENRLGSDLMGVKVRNVDGFKYGEVPMPFTIARVTSLPNGPYGEYGPLVIYNNGLYLWTPNTGWELLASW